jgi:hypothetical protein
MQQGLAVERQNEKGGSCTNETTPKKYKILIQYDQTIKIK